MIATIAAEASDPVAYRFNRRYRLEEMIPRLAWVALRTPPMPYHLRKPAENSA